MLIACVNQDRGIRPGGDKGAAVHVAAMRAAFVAEGAEVLEVDAKQDDGVRKALGRGGAVDLVYERYALGRDQAGRFAQERGLPHVLEVNAPLLEEAARHRGELAGPEQHAREYKLLSRASCLLAVSSQVADWLAGLGLPRERIRVRPNAVDGEHFHIGLRNPQPSERFVLGFHARLRPWHRFDDLVTVCSRLLDAGLDLELSVVGKGDFEQALSGRLPDDRWRLAGWTPHPQLGALVARFDALALTHSPDGPCYFSPLKLLEAMAVGAVPVVPGLGDLPRVVRHGHDGLVYPAGDLEALQHCLAGLVTDREHCARLGRVAAASAATRSWRALARELIDELPALSPAGSPLA